MKKILSTILIFLLTLHTFSNGLNLEKNYELVVSDLNNPWSFVFLSEKSMLITEKEGKLIHFENGVKTFINGLPEIVDIGQGGLLDIELHPKYKDNGWIYITYASSNDDKNGANTSLMRFKINETKISSLDV